MSELVALVQGEASVPINLRTAALRALAAQLMDRGRAAAVLAAISGGGSGGLLALLLHKSVECIVRAAGAAGHVLPPAGEAGEEAGSASGAAASSSGAATSSSGAAVGAAGGAAARDSGAAGEVTVPFLEALLSLVGALVSSTSGVNALADAGLIAALLPLLRDTQPSHVGLVCSAVKILEAYMDFSHSACAMFRDLGGLSEMISRLAAEVAAAVAQEGSAQQPPQPQGQQAGQQGQEGQPEVAAPMELGTPAPPAGEGAAPVAEAPAAAVEGAAAAGAAAAAPASAAPAAKQIPYSQRVLLKLLLRVIAISSYSPTSAAARPADADAASLYASLRAMFTAAPIFGGTLFGLAASVMTDLIHHEPQAFRQLDEAGLPEAYLDAVAAGVLPTSDAVLSIPNALVALCLNQSGLARVADTHALAALVPILTSRKYVKALAGDVPASLGTSLEELFRFVPQLRPAGVDTLVALLRGLAVLGGAVLGPGGLPGGKGGLL